jgi:hypothetical protein
MKCIIVCTARLEPTGAETWTRRVESKKRLDRAARGVSD